ncbi:MFS transporter [Mesorhizobium sp. B1-1-8]|uniref:MFS transporter n=1 Tax=Mesorhizobium sp. B1-1-8 TaxID=2589976 RepID=UPI00112871AA|nr:MFS transporter [Mesorhizobium sp. B1-1-8]UCI05203.1 MFS transporter [Mesorhizobium sp. B1-1-8]
MSNRVRIRHANAWAHLSIPLFGFVASTLSAAIGRNGYYIATAWILVERGYGSAGVATLLAVVSVVEFIASPLVGAAADRFDRRRLNLAADFGRFLVTIATACALLYLDAFVTICLSAALFSFYDRMALTTSQSMIPAVASGRNLVAMNSIVFFVTQFGNLAAALLAGPLMHERSPALPFTALAALFLVSTGFLALMRLAPLARDVRIAMASAIHIDLGLLRLIVVYTLLYASAVLVSVMGSSFVFQEQKGTALDFGYLEAAWSVGSLIGAISLVRVERVMSPPALHLVLLSATGLVLMAVMSVPMPWTLILFAALGFLYNLGRVSVEVTFQSRISLNLLGRAKGVMHSAAVLFGLLVFGVAAVVGDRAFPSTIFFAFGVVLLISISALNVCVVQMRNR